VTVPSAAATPPQHDDLANTLRKWSSHRERGVIFDFNGTLSNDETILLRIYTELFEQHLRWHLTPRHYFARFAGRSDREIVEIVVEELAGEDEGLVARLLAERRRRYCELVEEESPISEGSRRLVLRLAEENVPVGIVTGAQRPDVSFVLARSGLTELFTAVVTEEDVAHGKPHPEGFLLAARQLEVDPQRILVFEDSVPGVRGAKAAGMTCVAVEGTTDPDLLRSHADALITGFDQLRWTADPKS
jgi:beta-phosphoglucomutase